MSKMIKKKIFDVLQAQIKLIIYTPGAKKIDYIPGTRTVSSLATIFFAGFVLFVFSLLLFKYDVV